MLVSFLTMVQRFVIMAAGEGEARIVRSLPRPFDQGGMLDDAGVPRPTPDRPVRIPLGAMRFRVQQNGTLSWDTEAASATVAWFEISIE
jgi:hypothetical protein